MKIAVNLEVCESNQVCEGLAPSVFRVNEDDVLEILMSELDASNTELVAKIRKAVSMCPKDALSIVDE